MRLKKEYLTFLPIIFTVTSGASTRVETKSSCTGDNCSTSINSEIKINNTEQKVFIEQKEAGSLNVKIDEDGVVVKESTGSAKPTIIITKIQIPSQGVLERKEVETFNISKSKEIEKIYTFVKGLLSRLFSNFTRKP